MNTADDVQICATTDLDIETFHALLKLRVDVFVVEQECPYAELDGRDVEPGTKHLWTADADSPTAYLRLLSEPDGTARIGRVCTRKDRRSAGLAAKLMTAALAESGSRPAVLDAQSHLTSWYARFGFAVAGADYLEDGIPHTPMSRTASQLLRPR
ncbi:GNAT family N-acetyltransferase [Fodinicola feengrottensis]|uniref:GNAT family N-acetyltransferase n=1 Tax=Fodinicola feengrottensis TaxID=435914 RepID=A0ABN2J4Z8_9ACTN|nr:GNAT family N-acetyltransferase [Fodinicola feengrottensis]